MSRLCVLLLFVAILVSCTSPDVKTITKTVKSSSKIDRLKETSIVILGTIQDAGSPQIGCLKECCSQLMDQDKKNRKVCSMGVINPNSRTKYLIDATPNISEQLNYLNKLGTSEKLVDGIFLTHAHIGHYTGLMYLGKEGVSARDINVYALSRMKNFLETNGPWEKLVQNKNIKLKDLSKRDTVFLDKNLKVLPIVVPHRDEYSETVGYKIIGETRSALFIPDIDKWDKWDVSIIQEISKVDYAFIDGTFYDGEEINHRDISEIPHPFIIESMSLLKNLSSKEKNKVYFIHLNHTNPALDEDSNAFKQIHENGFHVARINEVFSL
ncbi:MAG: MBL fold metallo-hydrolase [Crocinitomicaceae bacterium]|nr:MBL fold metallo-hydrolase [Crocinitomicaceae bacterium]